VNQSPIYIDSYLKYEKFTIYVYIYKLKNKIKHYKIISCVKEFI